MNKIDIKSLTLYEFENLLEIHNLPKYSALQVFEWIHKKGVNDFNLMTNISIKNRKVFSDLFFINKITIAKKLISKLDNTVKYLYNLSDGEIVETVVMDYDGKKSVCISTQVGCKMGCQFCASANLGFIRNLTASEMLDEIYEVEKDLNVSVSNVVLMGIGEPLDNYENVLKFLKILNEEKGRHLSLRKVSLSSCGVCDIIDKMAHENLGITLSISLHASNNAVRDSLMPINKLYNIQTLIKSCRKYVEKTGRRITFEYICIDGINDKKEDAKELARLIKNILCHVNLLAVNPVSGKGYKTSRKNLELMKTTLEQEGITTTIRRRLGKEVNAACGQLRRDRIEKDSINGGKTC